AGPGPVADDLIWFVLNHYPNANRVGYLAFDLVPNGFTVAPTLAVLQASIAFGLLAVGPLGLVGLAWRSRVRRGGAAVMKERARLRPAGSRWGRRRTPGSIPAASAPPRRSWRPTPRRAIRWCSSRTARSTTSSWSDRIRCAWTSSRPARTPMRSSRR